MRMPIQYALYYPERRPLPVDRLDFLTLQQIRFEAPDTDTFLGLPLAREAAQTGGSMPTVFNAANEKAVALFLREKIRFLEMNAEQLDFPDDSFDVIVSRNLTWNLPHPEKAYAEWSRVLRPGGLLLNFDANWYSYLFDSESLSAYKTDRINAAAEGIHDANIGENFDIMEDIARRIPLSGIRRPGWDLDILGQLGLRAEADETFWERVWSREEKINFSSTPMFIVRAGA
jgi:SAM-dependent methyltransferase